MLIKLLKRLSFCVAIATMLFSNLSYAQQDISLDMRDDCVQLIRPFYGEAYAVFVRGNYRDNNVNSLRGYYDKYLKTYPKNNFSSLYSEVLQQFHEYTGGTHRLAYNMANFIDNNKSFDPIIDLTDYLNIVYGFEREEVQDDAESVLGKHTLNLLCANQLDAAELHIYYSIDADDRVNYEKQKQKGSERAKIFLRKHGVKNIGSNYHLYHKAKDDLIAQQQELQKHVSHIQSYKDYLDHNDIDLSGLINFMNTRINSLNSVIEELTGLGY